MKVQLLDICHARSGDKGDAANIGLIAREERFYPIIKEKVTRAALKLEGLKYLQAKSSASSPVANE
ncbi:MAG TPA: hypothetical protein VFD13_03855 [Candidatus Kapabacteria bacterium]|nr:hypothetical protein [Candidatus Kapabacteria bacterium]